MSEALSGMNLVEAVVRRRLEVDVAMNVLRQTQAWTWQSELPPESSTLRDAEALRGRLQEMAAQRFPESSDHQEELYALGLLLPLLRQLAEADDAFLWRNAPRLLPFAPRGDLLCAN